MKHEPPSPSLRILTGLHAGVACTLPDGRFSIGSARPADILLADEHVAPKHLVIECNDNGLRLSADADGVMVEGMHLSAGDVVAAMLPVTISIGTVELRCEAGIGAAAPRRLLRWPSAWLMERKRLLVVGAGAAFGAALLLGAAMIPAATDAFASPRRKQPSSQAVELPQAGGAGTGAVSDATLQSETLRQLQANGLSDISLSVSSGVVTAQGQLDPSSAGRLHDVELWFDHRFGETAVFMSQVSAHPARKFTIPLDAVWAGSNPNVVVHGQRYYVGASLPGGASIDQITQHEVLVTQGGQHYAVSY